MFHIIEPQQNYEIRENYDINLPIYAIRIRPLQSSFVKCHYHHEPYFVFAGTSQIQIVYTSEYLARSWLGLILKYSW